MQIIEKNFHNNNKTISINFKINLKIHSMQKKNLLILKVKKALIKNIHLSNTNNCNNWLVKA